MVLHGLLHGEPELGSGDGSFGEPELVNVGNGCLTSVVGQSSDLLTRLGLLGDGLGAGAAKDDQVEEGVGAETVGAVHGGAGGLAGGVQAGDNLVGAVLVGDDLAKKQFGLTC